MKIEKPHEANNVKTTANADNLKYLEKINQIMVLLHRFQFYFSLV